MTTMTSFTEAQIEVQVEVKRSACERHYALLAFRMQTRSLAKSLGDNINITEEQVSMLFAFKALKKQDEPDKEARVAVSVVDHWVSRQQS